MKDIGKLSRRLGNVEKMTTLNLLERNALGFETLDANGLSRFKSGIVVDNFQGHRVGDAFHIDYKNSMDFLGGTLRSIHVSKSVDLEENVSTESARTSAGYQKTGDLITLPYTEVVLTEQPFASTVERVAPFMTATWKGVMTIDPTQDNWMETEIAPQLIINREGNYDATVAAIGNNMGSVWNSWQTTWSGTVQRDDGVPPPQAAEMGAVGDDWGDDMDGPGGEDANEGAEGGDGGGKVLCGELYRQGLLPHDIYMGDLAYARDYVHEYTRNGYLIWANPLVRLMRKSKLVTNMVKPIASAWAEEMAYRASNVGNGNKFGATLFYLAPICTGIGAVLKLFNVETCPESIRSFVENK